MIHDAGPPDDLLPNVLVCRPEVDVIIEHTAFTGAFQADENGHHGAFAAAAAAHDDENVTVVDREIQIAHQDEIPIPHGQVLDRYVRLWLRHALYASGYAAFDFSKTIVKSQEYCR